MKIAFGGVTLYAPKDSRKFRDNSVNLRNNSVSQFRNILINNGYKFYSLCRFRECIALFRVHQ